MDREKLIERIKETFGKLKVLELSRVLRKEQFDLLDLIGITHHKEEAIAFRAAWILENLYLQRPEAYVSHLAKIWHYWPGFPGRLFRRCADQYCDRCRPESKSKKIADLVLCRGNKPLFSTHPGGAFRT